MNERNLEDISRYLQREDVQERVQRNIDHGRSQITVSIGGAVDLFGFSENQLRKWEVKGLLKPQRAGRQRHYSLPDLDKLAIIRELINAKYSPGDIPPNIDSIWYSISPLDGQHDRIERQGKIEVNEERETESLPINQRIENAREELFWRYYASHALRLSLILICDELPGTPGGLLLPLRPDPSVAAVRHVKDLPQLGESLVGWLSKTRSSHTLLTSAPSFQYPTDFSLLPLTVMKDDIPQEEPKDNTRIVLDRLDRRSRGLSLSASPVETIRQLLAPLYEEAHLLRSYFGFGMRDELNSAPNLENTSTRDMLLDSFADMIVRLGGKTEHGQDLWKFCCILLPKDPSLPIQQRTLVVRAQSQHSRHKVGGTTLPPDKSVNSLSLRAYQSGNIIYHPHTDAALAHHEVEGPVTSAIAMPIGGEDGMAIAALFVASYQKDAFSTASQRTLRMIGRMIQEIILTYRARQQVAGRLTNIIDRPLSVDPLFEDFLSENDFVYDLDALLTKLKAQLEEWKEPKPREEVPRDKRQAQYRAGVSSGEVVSFIAVDIDNQSSLGTRYGDQVTRNLSKEVGLRIRDQQHLFANPNYRKLYHVHADRFYLLLKGMALEEARSQAEQLRVALQGRYDVEARRISAERLMLPESKFELPHVTVRLGVTSYAYKKLEEVLQRYAYAISVAEVRAEIMHALDSVLVRGQKEGGNVIVSWDVDTWGYIFWSPTNSDSVLHEDS